MQWKSVVKLGKNTRIFNFEMEFDSAEYSRGDIPQNARDNISYKIVRRIWLALYCALGDSFLHFPIHELSHPTLSPVGHICRPTLKDHPISASSCTRSSRSRFASQISRGVHQDAQLCTHS